jgi:hypothetical protein
MPLFTQADVRGAILTVSTTTTGLSTVEVFTEFPSDLNKISEGIYVARVYQADRVISTNGITPGGHVYQIKDRIEMYVITQQVNPFVEGLLALFPTLVDNSLFSGYYLREHTIEQQYVNNSERYKIVFDLTRLQII